MAPKSLTATERALRSREATKAAMARELLFVAVLSRVWPSFVTDPQRAQSANGELSALVCLDTPVGRIVWRVSDEELPLFAHLEERPNDGVKAEDKMGVLMALATEGWMTK